MIVPAVQTRKMVVGRIGRPVAFPGDLNGDGVVEVNDAAPLALALVDPAAYQAAYPGCDPSRADLNAGGAADGQDIQPFVDALLTP